MMFSPYKTLLLSTRERTKGQILPAEYNKKQTERKLTYLKFLRGGQKSKYKN
jgi:hypothetical protein